MENTQLGTSAITDGGSTNDITLDPDGVPLGETSGGSDYYFITDPATQTVLAVTNSSGSIVRTNAYDPYGAEDSSGSGPNDIGWDGSLNVPGSPVDHFGARQLLQAGDRWTQPDPDAASLAADPTQDDPYAFAGDDPVDETDTSGLAGINPWAETHVCTKTYYAHHRKWCNGGVIGSGRGLSLAGIFHWLTTLPNNDGQTQAGTALGTLINEAKDPAELAYNVANGCTQFADAFPGTPDAQDVACALGGFLGVLTPTQPWGF